MSVVDQVLREDPAGVYAAMDFATRDRYRHVVEEIAKRSPLLADRSRRVAPSRWRAAGVATADGDDRAAHVGFYLIDKGRPRLERAAQLPSVAGTLDSRGRPPVPARAVPRRDRRADGCDRGGRRRQGSSFGVSAMGRGGGRHPARPGREPARRHPRELAGDDADRAATAAAAGFLPAASRPRRGPWSPCRRCSSASRNVADLLEGLEVRYLANRDDHLHFAPADRLPGRAAGDACRGTRRCLRRAKEGIDALNVKYEGDRGRPVLPVPPPAALERARAGVDGLRAQARQAGRPQRAAARRRRRDASR